jgi:hypothetical protein
LGQFVSQELHLPKPDYYKYERKTYDLPIIGTILASSTSTDHGIGNGAALTRVGVIRVRRAIVCANGQCRYVKGCYHQSSFRDDKRVRIQLTSIIASSL